MLCSKILRHLSFIIQDQNSWDIKNSSSKICNTCQSIFILIKYKVEKAAAFNILWSDTWSLDLSITTFLLSVSLLPFWDICHHQVGENFQDPRWACQKDCGLTHEKRCCKVLCSGQALLSIYHHSTLDNFLSDAYIINNISTYMVKYFYVVCALNSLSRLASLKLQEKALFWIVYGVR